MITWEKIPGSLCNSCSHSREACERGYCYQYLVPGPCCSFLCSLLWWGLEPFGEKCSFPDHTHTCTYVPTHTESNDKVQYAKKMAQGYLQSVGIGQYTPQLSGYVRDNTGVEEGKPRRWKKLDQDQDEFDFDVWKQTCSTAFILCVKWNVPITAWSEPQKYNFTYCW